MSTEGIEAQEAQQPVPQEQPTLTAQQVAKIVQREKAEAAEKGRREAQAQYEKELAQYRGSQPQSMGGMSQEVDEEAMYKRFQERQMGDMRKQQEEERKQQHNRLLEDAAGHYIKGMERGKDLYSDFNEMTADFDPGEFSPLVILASKREDFPDIMYEFSQNPLKLASVNALAATSPKMAEKELNKLSESIRQNKTAKENNRSANPPLNRLQPSASAGADNGGTSVADFKKMPWLRV